jgi:hypothetical protein
MTAQSGSATEPNKQKFSSVTTKSVVNIAILVGISAVAVVLARGAGVSWLKIAVVSILIAVVFGLGVLNALNRDFREWFDRSSARLSNAYASFIGWMFLAFFPAFLLMKLHRGIVTLPRILQMVIFIVWGLLLAFAIWQVATEQKRSRLFGWLETRIGRFTPVAYSFNLLMVATIFFASVTYLSAYNRISRSQLVTQPVTVESIQDFYLWHFIEAVPLLKVNDTIGWRTPMKYDGHLVGWILLLFKLAVIIPVIACFASYWKNLDTAKSPPAIAHQ